MENRMKLSDLKGKYVYLSCPYASDPAHNVNRSIEITSLLIDQGAFVFNPLMSHFCELIYPKRADFWYAYDLEWLKKCDVLVYVPGESKGVDNEIAHAGAWGIPVIKWEE